MGLESWNICEPFQVVAMTELSDVARNVLPNISL